MVSVIIPVYKSEKTLKKCVESVLTQEYQDVEVILVVDGPPDGSGILAEKLALTDDRIRVINQSNQGVSRARNKGIEVARGEYIRFLDSDDYMEGDALGCMVRTMETDGSDLVIAGFHHLYYGQVIRKVPSICGCFETKQCFSQMKQLYEDGFLNMPWNKLFKKNLIQEGFPADISLGEDLIFNQYYILKTDKISVIDATVCEYIQDDRGTTLSTKKRDDKIEMALSLYEKSKGFFEGLYGKKLGNDKACSKESSLAFLEQKVITTFLDDVELLGFLDLKAKQRRNVIKVYAQNVCKFLADGQKTIKLQLLDYKIIYFFLKRNQIIMTDFCVSLRTLCVKAVRALKSK